MSESTATEYKIEKLNSDNYQIMKYKLELLLVSEDLWEVVTEERPTITLETDWKKKDAKARARIGLLVENDQLIDVRSADTAQKAWETLKEYHEKSTATSEVF